MANDELFQALNMFKNGMQDLQLSRVLNQANEQVQQIKATEGNEMKQRQALSQLAQGLVLQMSGLGADAAKVQQVFGAINPKPIASADQAILEGTLTGNRQLAQMGVEADKMQTANQLELFKAKAAIQAKAQEKLFAQQLKLAGMKQKAGGKPVSQGELDKIQGFDATTAQLNDMIAQVNTNPNLVGPLASRIPLRGQLDSEFAAFKQNSEQFFNEYRKLITGAGASEKELAMLRQATPSVNDRPNIFKAKAKAALKLADKIKQKYLANLNAGQRDVSQFRALEPAPGVPPTTPDIFE